MENARKRSSSLRMANLITSTVDVFNEGVDIPSINQVVMLRQTQSSIVFVQQLGRGLRKSPEKDYLVVIDFIGAYEQLHDSHCLLVDDSLNKESLRKNMIAAEEKGVLPGLEAFASTRSRRGEFFRRSLTPNLMHSNACALPF